MKNPEPQTVRMHVFSSQVCVPEDYTDQQVLQFVENENPAGTAGGWQIAENVEQRVKCDKREGYVHIVVTV